MNKAFSILRSLLTFISVMVFGLPLIYTALYHPISRIAGEDDGVRPCI